MKAKLLQGDPKNLRDGVIHKSIKPVKSRTLQKHVSSSYTSLMSNRKLFSPVSITSIPELGVKSKTEAISDTSCSPLPLESTGFRNKGLHQRAHLAALVISKEHRRLC